MMGPCMCGADDCPCCFPGNFRVIEGRRVYVGDLNREQISRLEDGLDPFKEDE